MSDPKPHNVDDNGQPAATDAELDDGYVRIRHPKVSDRAPVPLCCKWILRCKQVPFRLQISVVRTFRASGKEGDFNEVDGSLSCGADPAQELPRGGGCSSEQVPQFPDQPGEYLQQSRG